MSVIQVEGAEQGEAIPRLSGVSADDMRRFLNRHTSQAVILTDVVPTWPAFEKWTFDYIGSVCGDDSVVLSDDLAEPSQFRKRSVRQYVEYLKDKDGHSLSSDTPGVSWYAGYYSPFVKHPELLNDFSPPECLGSWFQHLEEPMREWYDSGFGWLLMGPRGTKTAAHFDLFNTHAWTAQLQGEKKFLFYPPDRQEPFDDVQRVMRQKPIETVLKRGELLIIPVDWCHAAIALQSSFTLTFNFVNETNFSRFLHSIYLCEEKWRLKGKNLLTQTDGCGN